MKYLSDEKCTVIAMHDLLMFGVSRRAAGICAVRMHVRRFQMANAVSRVRAHQQGQRESQPVVRMGFHFRQQITQ